MSLLVADDDKELARLNELERQLKLKKEKMDKNATRQKILLGAFLLDLLEHDKVSGLREYTVANLESFVSRDGEKNLVKAVIKNVKKLMNPQSTDSDIIDDKSDNNVASLESVRDEKVLSNNLINEDVIIKNLGS